MAPLRKGFLIRAAALSIDLVGVCLVYVVIALTISFVAPSGSWINTDRPLAAILWSLLIAWMFCEVLFAATPGKAILRLAVGNSDGTPASTATLTSRWIFKTWPFWLAIVEAIVPNAGLYWIAGIGQFGLLISFLASMNDGKQGWHDQFTGTAVYRTVDLDGPDTTPGGFEAKVK